MTVLPAGKRIDVTLPYVDCQSRWPSSMRMNAFGAVRYLSQKSSSFFRTRFRSTGNGGSQLAMSADVDTPGYGGVRSSSTARPVIGRMPATTKFDDDVVRPSASDQR